MSENWISSLDFCAANGLFNYDAAAFVLGQPQRYVGNPKSESIGNLPPLLQTVPNIKTSPAQDTFEGKKTPTWKKALLGLCGLALLIGGVVAYRKGKLSLSSLKSSLKLSNIKSKLSALKPKNFKMKWKRGLVKLRNAFKFLKKTKTPTPPAP